MRANVKSVLTLFAICAVVALMLAVTNLITAPVIAENEEKAFQQSMLEVLPEGEKFEKVDVSGLDLPSSITEVYTEAGGGYVFKIVTKGYSKGLVIMCGVDSDGNVTGTKSISNSETPSIGGAAIKKIAALFVGKNIADVDSVELISGATKTTAAYRAAFKDALAAAQIIGNGGEINE